MKDIKKKVLSETTTDSMDFPIVGIGASAGGLEALEQFFRSVPLQSGVCYVVVQHLDPTQRDFLCELLQRFTVMKVTQIEDRMRVQTDCVYVIPPDKNLTILHGTLFLLNPIHLRGHRKPIDFFFNSLADDRKENAICVILSGMGSDGTLGAKTIKEKGGLVFVQDPQSAKFNSMPLSVINDGLADVVAASEHLPDQIITRLKYNPYSKPMQLPVDEDQSAIEKIFILIRRKTGHDFSLYKHSTIYRRIERRMRIHQINKIDTYVKFLQENPHEIELLFNEILIGVTSFYRDPNEWEKLKDELKIMLKEKAGYNYQYRAWVAGCSTGEEAYTLAMLFKEAQEELELTQDVSVQIFATDIDAMAISKARSGFYSVNIESAVTADRLHRFFNKSENGYQISKSLREMIVFAQHNLVMDPPFSRIDVLSCRNVLIYMTSQLQKKIIPMFYYSLKPGGIMFLGTAETIGNFSNLFIPVSKKLQLYHKSNSTITRELFEMPKISLSTVNTTVHASKPTENMESMVDKMILQQYSPAAILTDVNGDILYISGKIGKYLEPASGNANLNIFVMAREEIRYQLMDTFKKAISANSSMSVKGILIKTDEVFHKIDFTVQPVEEAKKTNGNVLIVFYDVVSQANTEKEVAAIPGSEKEKWLEMQKKLDISNQKLLLYQEEMQGSQEDLKSANEELQSMNEEFQSTNEELTTSKEEMQSMNEELHSVNRELQERVNELTHANDDIKNLLNSIEIATVFLNNHMRIKSFTNQMSLSSKLIQSDIGRPITDIASELFYPEIEEDVMEVLRTLIPIDKMIIFQKKDKAFKLRIMPYRTTDNKIDGVVLTFIDVSVSRKLEIELKENRKKFDQVLHSSPVLLSNQDASMRYTWIYDSTSNLATFLMLGKTDIELFGQQEAKEMTELKNSVMKTGKSARKAVQLTIRGQVDIYDLYVNPMFNDSDTVTGIACVWFDTTEK